MENNGGGAMEENNGGGESASVVGASTTVKKAASDFFPNKAHVTDALRTILANLDVSDLTLAFEKDMETSDRDKGQHRLLMSCKCESKRASFARIFTETEMPLVHEPLKTEEDQKRKHRSRSKDKGKGKGKRKRNKKHGGGEDSNNKGCRSNNNGKHNDGVKEEDDEQGKEKSIVQGLAVEAYDCDGRAYELNIKYLLCNNAYRITGSDWTVFLINNGLLVGGGGGAVKTTPKKPSGLRRQNKKRRRSNLRDKEPPNDEQLAVQDAAGDIQIELWAFRSTKLSIGEKNQPGGALGVLLLHYRGGGDEAETEELQVAAAPQEAMVGVVVEQPRQKRHGNDMATQCGEDMPLGPLERLIVGWLSFNYHSHSDEDVNDD